MLKEVIARRSYVRPDTTEGFQVILFRPELRTKGDNTIWTLPLKLEDSSGNVLDTAYGYGLGPLFALNSALALMPLILQVHFKYSDAEIVSLFSPSTEYERITEVPEDEIPLASHQFRVVDGSEAKHFTVTVYVPWIEYENASSVVIDTGSLGGIFCFYSTNSVGALVDGLRHLHYLFSTEFKQSTIFFAPEDGCRYSLKETIRFTFFNTVTGFLEHKATP